MLQRHSQPPLVTPFVSAPCTLVHLSARNCCVLNPQASGSAVWAAGTGERVPSREGATKPAAVRTLVVRRRVLVGDEQADGWLPAESGPTYTKKAKS